MSWSANVQETIIEPAAGTEVFMQDFVVQAPSETGHIVCRRIDTPITQGWRISLYTSTDGTTLGIHQRWSLDAGTLTLPLIVVGVYQWKIGIKHMDLAPTDVVQVEINYRLNGVSL